MHKFETYCKNSNVEFTKKAMEFDKFPIKIIVLLYISEKTIGNGVGQRR
jgi:hypothetical protein